jgi:hypothetical protein
MSSAKWSEHILVQDHGLNVLRLQNPRFSPILLIYRFALWKTEETNFTCVLAVTVTTVHWAKHVLKCTLHFT